MLETFGQAVLASVSRGEAVVLERLEGGLTSRDLATLEDELQFSLSGRFRPHGLSEVIDVRGNQSGLLNLGLVVTLRGLGTPIDDEILIASDTPGSPWRLRFDVVDDAGPVTVTPRAVAIVVADGPFEREPLHVDVFVDNVGFEPHEWEQRRTLVVEATATGLVGLGTRIVCYAATADYGGSTFAPVSDMITPEPAVEVRLWAQPMAPGPPTLPESFAMPPRDEGDPIDPSGHLPTGPTVEDEFANDVAAWLATPDDDFYTFLPVAPTEDCRSAGACEFGVVWSRSGLAKSVTLRARRSAMAAVGFWLLSQSAGLPSRPGANSLTFTDGSTLALSVQAETMTANICEFSIDATAPVEPEVLTDQLSSISVGARPAFEDVIPDVAQAVIDPAGRFDRISVAATRTGIAALGASVLRAALDPGEPVHIEATEGIPLRLITTDNP